MRNKRAAERIRFKTKKEYSKRKRIIIEIILYVFELFLVIGLAYVIINIGVMKTAMVGDSMQKTLENGDDLLINKFIYRLSSPERFDIIAYRQDASEHSYITIKRIIGLPGEKVQIIDGKVFINGTQIDEVINVDKMNTAGLAQDEITLEKNEYFVLGDNRNNSEDSRFSSVDAVVKNEIIGKVWIRLNSFNFVNSLNSVNSSVTQTTPVPDK